MLKIEITYSRDLIKFTSNATLPQILLREKVLMGSLISVLNTRLVTVFLYFGCTWIIRWFKECFLFQRVDNLLTYFSSFLLMSIGSVVMSHPLFLQYSLDVYGICGKVLPFIFVILLLIMLLFLINLRLSVVFVISNEQ